MVTRPVVIAVICVGFFLILQALPKAMALKNPSSYDRYLMEGHRTHKKKNYIEQARDNEIIGSMENGVAYEGESIDPDRNPEELSAFIVDYANMIRNDVILLDKSIETRTRKRGNIKVKKYNNQVIPDPPCKCDHISHTLEMKEVFPPKIEIRKCKEKNSCMYPYECENNVYNLTILKKKAHDSVAMFEEDIILHSNLKLNWYVDIIPISVGCTCRGAYITKN